MHKQNSRLIAHSRSTIQSDILGDSDTEAAVSSMLQIFESCLGPYGRCKLIHNGLGGHVTVTSSSTRILQSLHLSSPVLTILSAAIQRHLASFSDCGSMAMTLALYIIKKSLNLNIPRHLLTEILSLCARDCIDYLNSDSCSSKVRISLENLDDMLRLVRGITSTKQGCCASAQDLEHINRCIIEIFLKSFNDKEFVNANSDEDGILYHVVEGAPIKESYVVEGFFVCASHIPTYTKQPFSTPVIRGGPRNGQIAVAIFNVSMAGDFDDYLDVNFESSSTTLLEDETRKQMMQLIVNLCNRGIGAVICQKVIHPKVKQLIRRLGMLVLDRLGVVHIKALHRVAGGNFYSSFLKPVDEADFGYLRKVSHKVINKKSYAHIVGTDESAQTFTLVLCGPSEESTTELKQVCSIGNHVLRQAMSTSRCALTGGGLWQHNLGMHLNELPNKQLDEWSCSLECNRQQVRTVLNVVADSLLKIHSIVSGVSITNRLDSSLDDCVADKQNTCEVLDAFIPATEAITSSLFSSSMILGIKNYISG